MEIFQAISRQNAGLALPFFYPVPKLLSSVQVCGILFLTCQIVSSSLKYRRQQLGRWLSQQKHLSHKSTNFSLIPETHIKARCRGAHL